MSHLRTLERSLSPRTTATVAALAPRPRAGWLALVALVAMAIVGCRGHQHRAARPPYPVSPSEAAPPGRQGAPSMATPSGAPLSPTAPTGAATSPPVAAAPSQAHPSTGGTATAPQIASQGQPDGAVAPSHALPQPSAPTAQPAPPPKPPEPQIKITLDTPHKMGDRPPAKTRAEYKADILDRRHWNTGGLGELTGELPGPEGHPDPRVIVNVDKVRGSHKAKSLQRIARKYHWMNVIRCYRLGAYKDRHMRGWTHATFRVNSRGKVRRSRLRKTELKDAEVARCIADKLKKLKFKKARRGSRVWVSIKVGPGDEPMAPPRDLLVPGEGSLGIDEMKAGVEAGLPAFGACYREGLKYAPGLWGRVVLRFHLTKHGRLDEVFQTGSRFPDARVRQCIEHAARKLRFPNPKGGELRFVVALRLSTPHADTLRPTPD